MQLDTVPEGLPSHFPRQTAWEEYITGFALEQHRTRLDTIALDPDQRLFSERHQALLVTLGVYAQHTLTQVHLIQPQTNQLTDPQATGVKHFQHAAITQSQAVIDIRRRQQGLHVRLAERVRQRPAEPRHGYIQRRVFGYQTFTQRMPIKTA